MLPPRSDGLLPRVASRNARRAREVRLRLPDFAESRQDRETCRALAAVLRSLRGRERARFHLAPETLGWLSAIEEAMSLARPLEERLELFERVSQGSHLATLVPRGRLDPGFRRRTMALGARLVARAFRTLPPVLAFLTPAGRSFGPFVLEAAGDGEEARREGEIHLRFPVPATLRVRTGARLQLVDGGIRIAQPGPHAASWTARETIPGTGIVLARRVVRSRRGLRPAGHLAGLAERLGEALQLVRDAWRAAHHEVCVHTSEVVPLAERGVVSYSLPTRPGTSYVNVEGKRLVDLADDLVHEAAHHRLHHFEQLRVLHRAGDDAIYYSPWRRSLRPLNGILHAAYTFTFRAELFQRMLALRSARLPRAWMRGQVRREINMLRRSLVDLDEARGAGLLTAAGAELVGAISRHVSRLARGA